MIDVHIKLFAIGLLACMALLRWCKVFLFGVTVLRIWVPSSRFLGNRSRISLNHRLNEIISILISTVMSASSNHRVRLRKVFLYSFSFLNLLLGRLRRSPLGFICWLFRGFLFGHLLCWWNCNHFLALLCSCRRSFIRKVWDAAFNIV